MTEAPSAQAVVPLPARSAYGLGLLTALLYFLAFPGMDVWPLSFVAFAPLIVALEGQSIRRSTGIGLVSGFAATMAGFYWLLEMLKTFSGFPTAVCLLFMSLLCLYQGGRIALVTWLYARARARGWPGLPVFFLAFATSELVFPLLFPWYLGACVHQVPVLTQTAELGGPILVGWVLLTSNWLIAEFMLSRRGGPRPSWRRSAALLAVPVAAVVYGAIRIHQVDGAVSAAPKAEVGIVQANMSLFGKRQDPGEGLRRHLRLTERLKAEGPLDLVVWSETSATGAVAETRMAEEYPRRFTRALGVPTIFGAVLVHKVNDARGYGLYNSALLSDANGEILGRYDKTYLLAFGEYLPLGNWFPILYEWSPNTGKFTPGSSLAAIPLGKHKISVHICYEDVLPAFVNAMMRADPAELLVNITNDAWFGDSTEPWIHLALAKFRAIEQRRFLVRSTNSGVSAIIDPVGRVTGHTGTFEQATLRGTIAWLDGGTPYRLWGDSFWWLGAALSAVAAFRRRPPPAPTGAKT